MQFAALYFFSADCTPGSSEAITKWGHPFSASASESLQLTDLCYDSLHRLNQTMTSPLFGYVGIGTQAQLPEYCLLTPGNVSIGMIAGTEYNITKCAPQFRINKKKPSRIRMKKLILHLAVLTPRCPSSCRYGVTDCKDLPCHWQTNAVRGLPPTHQPSSVYSNSVHI